MSVELHSTQPAVNGLTSQNYRFLQEHVYRQSGIVLENDKEYLLESRLMPIVAEQKLGTLNELCLLLQRGGSQGLNRQVVEAMTTNETSFFRDPTLWEELRTLILPELIEQRKQTRRLRFWSAASSSGQEAYSLAITLLQMGLKDWDVRILGSDLSQQMVDRATSGEYVQLEVNRGLPARHLVQYFSRKGMYWRVNDEIRRWTRFQQLDLRHPLKTFGPFDIVFCRNVLIYFDVRTKQQILKELKETLFTGGYLVLGSAETTLNLNTSFIRCPATRTSFYKVP